VISADILKRLAALQLQPEDMSEVLAIIADMQTADDERKARQRERTARSRDKYRAVTLQTRDSNITSNVTPPSPNDGGDNSDSPEINLNPVPPIVPPSQPKDDEPAEALRAYNSTAHSVGWPKAQKLTDTRRSTMRARLKDAGGLAGWSAAMERASRSTFLTGGNAQGWRADLDFFLQAKRFIKLLEGGYDDKKPPIASNSPNTGRPEAGSVLSAGLRRLARLDQRERGAASGDFDFGGDEEADGYPGRSPIGNHGGQKASGRDEGSDGFALFLPSTGRQ